VEQAAAPAYGLLGGQPDPLVPAGEEEVAAR